MPVASVMRRRKFCEWGGGEVLGGHQVEGYGENRQGMKVLESYHEHDSQFSLHLIPIYFDKSLNEPI